ncbi:MAG: PAS domain S-box protein, partial [Deltaproteobacteria bacterium]|nr:PAS domain S-box protein [Deltaproteobacteria bacterium]
REVDQRITSLLLKIIDFYVARFNQRLIRQSEMLSRRNDELQALRLQLSSDLRATAGQLAEAEQLKARVTERISSGIMLVERQTHRILLFNAVMEKLTGLSGTEVLNRPVDEILHFVEGVPAAEFAEQVQLHGEVGLRKLRLRMANDQEKTVYVRGQVFEGRHNQPDSTLFVIDDVTEREDIIENFSRYVSRDVVNRILQKKPQGGVQPSGELRRAVLLACGIRDFRQLIKDQGPTEVTALLTEYIRTVSDAIFRHGGTIDSVVGDALLVYFSHDNMEAPCEIPVEAALDVQARFEKLNDEREKDGKAPLLVGLGLHVGEIFVLNVGNERRMVHTVVGEAAVIAQALQDIASGGEILLSDDVRRCSNGRFSLASGPMLTVKGQGNLEVFRLLGLEEQTLTATFRMSQEYPERSDPGEHARNTKPSGSSDPS